MNNLFHVTTMLTSTPFTSFKRSLAKMIYNSRLPGSQKLARFIYGKNGLISEFVKPDQDFQEFIKWKRTKLQNLINLNFWLKSFSSLNKADQLRLFHFYLVCRELNNWKQVDLTFSKLVTNKEEFKVLFELLCSVPSLKPTPEDFEIRHDVHLKTDQKNEVILNTYVKKVLGDYIDFLPHTWSRGILEEHFRNLLENSHYVKKF